MGQDNQETQNVPITKERGEDYWFGKWLSSPPPGEEVVVSGMSGIMPESEDIQEFSDNLYNKVDMIRSDSKRFDMTQIHEAVRRAGRLREVDNFDPGYFGIHYRQATSSDPMLRMVMECAVAAIMDAGMHPSELEGTKTAVFMGATTSDTEKVTLNCIDEPEQFGLTGFLRSMLSNRISYFLRVKGPSMIADTACSSYLNALEHAFKTIRTGEADMALVGCCTMNCHPGSTINFHRLGVLSADGVPRVFDEGANGYVRSEAVGCVFLQKAKDARRIYCRIVHAKINDDGYKKEGITVPSIQLQSELLKEIYDESNHSVDEIAYLEAHATGTKVGDPQEVEAIDWAIGKLRSKQLRIGSVKSNLGHTEPCAGFCSLVKVLLAFETGFIPPNINFSKPREGIAAFIENRMRVVTENDPLEEEAALVGINNFGFGGNNSHLAVTRFDKIKKKEFDNLPRLVVVNARSKATAESILNGIKQKQLDPEFVALLHKLYCRDSITHFIRGYTVITKHGSTVNSVGLRSFPTTPVAINFGKLTQYKSLGKFLWESPEFRNAVESINNILAPRGIRLDHIILKNKAVNCCDDVLGSLGVQLALADVFKALELIPSSISGVGEGKIVCAYFENKISLRDAVAMVYKYLEKSKIKENDSAELNYVGFNLDGEKKSIVLNFDESLDAPKGWINVTSENFMETLGSLYQHGHNLNLPKLYPEVQFPVSRSTPMISPIYKWCHETKWKIFKYTDFNVTKVEQKDHRIFLQVEEDKYIAGHVIDGRNLFPATGYLWLVWSTIASSRQLLPIDLPVIFENCRFMRAVNVPSKGSTRLFVTIRKGTGDFEVLEGDSLVVNGRITVVTETDNFHSGILPIPEFTEDDPCLGMTQDEIYRELNLRGYNYSGLFRGLAKCDLNGTKGIVKWESNWVAFMDKMLQLKLLQYDTRLLYVPVGIERLVIDPITHQNYIETLGENKLVPVYACKEANIVVSGGIEIQGLYANSIPRRRQLGEPVLEKYQFIPNNTSLTIAQALRVNVQIILENSLEPLVKSVEVIDDSTTTDAEPILPLIAEVLSDIPLVKFDFTISSKTPIENVTLKVEPVNLTSENKLSLLVASKILQRQALLQQALKSTKEKGFILSREDKDSPLADRYEGLTILTVLEIPDEKLVFLRKNFEIPDGAVVEVTSQNYDWIPKIQDALQNSPSVTIYSQNEPQNGFLGLINCLRREPNGDKLRGFFITGNAPTFDLKSLFYSEQLARNFAVNVYQDGQWGTYRHLKLDSLNEVSREHCYVNVTVRGNLSSLKWIEGPLSKEGPNTLKEQQTLVTPYYSTLNFRDIMTASGRINPDIVSSNRIDQECIQGFEYAGRDVTGRRVMGFVHGGALATLVKADNELIFEIPDAWSMEEAASVPVVYGTVLYALVMRNRFKRGSSILIHAGSGGIGIAAINVALHQGLEIYTTVGTEEKREFIKKTFPQIPESHIGNSRNISFEEMISVQTKGRGVDVVINSLADEKLIASVRCLAQGGTFLEIGKFDLAKNSPLEMELLRKEGTFQGIMLDCVFTQTSSQKAYINKVLNEAIADGYIKPLPRTVFTDQEIEQAFRYMAGGKHIGKVVIKIRDEEAQNIIVPEKLYHNAVPRFYCNPAKVQVIVGGLGGIGLELADWLILRGARKLVLTSRTGISSTYQQWRKQIWESYGVVVDVNTADVTTLSGAEELITNSLKLGEIDGIFNLAVVLKDVLFEKQNEESFCISYGPKAAATYNLDAVTRELCKDLRYFVVFSSVSCGRGNTGQTNYGMANAVMERICEKRKSEGLPALAIQWGAIGDVGLVAKMQKENRILEIGGTLQQRISSCMEVMDVFMNQDAVVVSSMVVAEKRRAFAGSAVDAVAHILGIKDIKSVNPNTTLAELGMDSITGTEIYQVLEKDFEIALKPEDMRTLTFGKLMELEAEKKKNEGGEKTKRGINMMLKYMPDAVWGDAPVLRMKSKIDEESQSPDSPVVFVLPGIEGCLKDLEFLAQNTEAIVYALQYSYNKPEKSIEDIAKTALPHLLEKLPKDQPFVIIGYSMGAIVGLELVALLEAKNHLGTLIAIDGSPVYTIGGLKQYTAGTTDENDLDTLIVSGILSVVIPMEKIVENREKILKCKDYKERIQTGMALVPRDDIKKQEVEPLIAEAGYHRFKSLLVYEYAQSKLNSEVILFRASVPMLTDIGDDYKLGEVCANPVKSVVIEGDHVTLVSNQSLYEACNRVIKGEPLELPPAEEAETKEETKEETKGETNEETKEDPKA